MSIPLLEKVAFLGGLVRGLGRAFMRSPLYGAGLALGAHGQAGAFNDEVLSKLTEGQPPSNYFGGGLFRLPGVGEKTAGHDLEAEFAEDTTVRMDPVQGAKYALMLFSREPEVTAKIAGSHLQAAVHLAQKDFAELVKAASARGAEFPEADQLTRDMCNRTVEFKDVSRESVKMADYLLRKYLPSFYKNAEARFAFLCYACAPEAMRKTAAFRTAPSAFERFNIPLAATLALGLGVAGGAAALGKAQHKVNEMTSYGSIIEQDPELAQHPPEKVKRVITDLYAMAPDVMARPTVAAHLVRQMVMAPPGGVSIDFADKLMKAQGNLDPGILDKTVKVLGPASSVVGNVLHYF